MDEYITKASAVSVLLHNQDECCSAVIQEMEDIPFADVAPVVHARWIWNPNGMDYGLGAWQCGRCFTRNNSLPMNSKINPLMFIGSKYCPECGAKMDAEKEEPYGET